MRVKSPRIIQHRERKNHWLWGLGMLVLAVALWQVYQFGRIQGGYDDRRVQAERQQLLAELNRLQEQLERFQGEAARYRRQAQIEQQAGRELQQELIRFQDEQARLRSEVKLLKGLISSGAGSLYIKDFRLEPAGEPGRYRYAFTLVQVKEKVETTRGKLVMKLSGVMGKQKKRLDRAAFSPDGEKVIKLEFKHYEDVAGEILLPEKFRPRELKIEFLPRNKELKKLETTIPWPAEGR
jgi:cell division protein FtsL